MSSLRLKAPPCWDVASMSSLASRWAIVFSRRARANSTSQRTARVRARREGVVDDALGGGLLAVQHHLVDDLLDEARAVDGVRLDRPDLGCGAAGHRYFLFTPYCERAFLRSLTPAASSVPRTTL